MSWHPPFLLPLPPILKRLPMRQTKKHITMLPKDGVAKALVTAQRVHNGDFSAYKLPVLEYANQCQKSGSVLSLKKDLKSQAEVLEETLQSFGIEAKVGKSTAVLPSPPLKCTLPSASKSKKSKHWKMISPSTWKRNRSASLPPSPAKQP